MYDEMPTRGAYRWLNNSYDKRNGEDFYAKLIATIKIFAQAFLRKHLKIELRSTNEEALLTWIALMWFPSKINSSFNAALKNVLAHTHTKRGIKSLKVIDVIEAIMLLTSGQIKFTWMGEINFRNSWERIANTPSNSLKF